MARHDMRHAGVAPHHDEGIQEATGALEGLRVSPGLLRWPFVMAKRRGAR